MRESLNDEFSSEHIFSTAETLLKKYAAATRVKRGKEPFISIFIPVMKEYEVRLSRSSIVNFGRNSCVKILVCVHYPPSRPAYHLGLGLDVGENLWKAELEGWETRGKYTHSKQELPEYNLLHPTASMSKKVKVGDVCNDKKFSDEDVKEMVETVKSLNENVLAERGIKNVKSMARVDLVNELYCDTLGNAIEQEKSFWYLETTTSVPCPDLYDRELAFSHTIGAFGGLKTFRSLEKKLFEACMDLARRNLKFSRARRGYKKFRLTTGNYKVVLDGRVTGVSLHEYGAGHAAEAHRILEGSEALIFEGKLDKRVASPEVTLVDYSQQEINGMKPISFYVFDAEGVEKLPVKIVENGIFRSYLHSKLTAGTIPKERGGGKLTGNARVEITREWNVEKVVKEPCPRMSTLYLESKDYKLEELLEEARGGLYISSGSPSGSVATELGVGYVDVNEIYFIDRNAELIPLRVPNSTVSLVGGTSLMNKMKGIGDESTIAIDTGYCGAESGIIPHTIFAPAVLIEDIQLVVEKAEEPLKKPLVKF